MLRRSVISFALVFMFAFPALARTRPRYGGTLRIETQNDPWQVPDGLARRLVFDTLTTLSDAGATQPALAVRWESQNADRRWEFFLRSGVHFHSGAPLTAESVVSALQQTCSAPGVAPCPWTAVRAVGSSVVFVTDVSSPDLPELLAQTEFAIAHQDAAGAVDGTGPFRVTGFAGGVLTLAANDDSWQGRPFLDSIQIYPHRSVRDQWLDLSVGRADVVEVPPELLHQAQDQHLTLLTSQPVDLLALTVAAQGPLAGLETREAIASAVDRAAICNVIFQKQGEITASLLPHALSGYSFLFSEDRDLDRARTLRGGANVPPLMLTVSDSTPSLQLAAERLALNLHEAGFTVQVGPGGRAPAPLTLRLVHPEAAGARATLDELLARFGQNSTVTGTDPASLYQAERNALANATVVPLLWLPRAWAVSERVRDVRLSPDGIPLLAGASLEGAP